MVDKTINEFPAFSFLLSCFHAHVLTLAFTILAIGLIFNLFLERGDGGEDGDAQGLRIFGRGWRLPLNLGFMAIVIGGLFAMNGWDFPTYLGTAIVCIALQQWMTYHSRFSFELALDVFTACASLTALSFFLYAPFYLNFISPSQGIGIVGAADRSSVSSEMLIYGTFMFLFVTLLFVNFMRDRLVPGNPAFAKQRPDKPGTSPIRPFLASLSKPSNGTNGTHATHTSRLLTRIGASEHDVSGAELFAAGEQPSAVQARQQTATVSQSLPHEQNLNAQADAPEQSNGPISPLPPLPSPAPARPARPSWLTIPLRLAGVHRASRPCSFTCWSRIACGW